MAVLDELRYNARKGRMGNDDDLTARPEGRHTQAAAGRIEYRPALLAMREIDIEEDATIDQPAAKGMPLAIDQVDDAQSGAGAARTIGAVRKRQRTHMRFGRNEG